MNPEYIVNDNNKKLGTTHDFFDKLLLLQFGCEHVQCTCIVVVAYVVHRSRDDDPWNARHPPPRCSHKLYKKQTTIENIEFSRSTDRQTDNGVY